MWLRPLYDVVVVGSGPAGSMSAWAAAREGLEVLLVTRSLEVGVPSKCGEFLPSLEEMKRLAPNAKGLGELFDPPPSFIVNRTRRIRFFFPGGTEVAIPFKGVVVERKLYDKHLAASAARAGAEVALRTRAIGLLPEGRGVRVMGPKGVEEVASRLVIGADGTYSLIAREAGLPVSRDPLDYAVGYQYEMVNVDHAPDEVDMYIGGDVAPGTYAWIIPKGGDIANVGTGVRSPFIEAGLSVRDYQRRLVEEHPAASEKLRRAAVVAVKPGCVPCGGPMERTQAGNILVVGDAAGQTIPTVGAGVPPALICGRIAGRAAARHLHEGVGLSLYEEEWRRQLGETLGNSLRLRRMADVVFGSDRMFSFVARRGWINEEVVEKVILCRVDGVMRLVEKALIPLARQLLPIEKKDNLRP